MLKHVKDTAVIYVRYSSRRDNVCTYFSGGGIRTRTNCVCMNYISGMVVKTRVASIPEGKHRIHRKLKTKKQKQKKKHHFIVCVIPYSVPCISNDIIYCFPMT